MRREPEYLPETAAQSTKDAAEMPGLTAQLAGAPRDGFCYCDMCCFNAELPAKYRKEVEEQHACPDCKTAFLVVADALPEHVAEDESLEVWSLAHLDHHKRTCNRHLDCHKADILAREQGRISAEHCNDSCCPDCFGQ